MPLGRFLEQARLPSSLRARQRSTIQPYHPAVSNTLDVSQIVTMFKQCLGLRCRLQGGYKAVTRARFARRGLRLEVG